MPSLSHQTHVPAWFVVGAIGALVVLGACSDPGVVAVDLDNVPSGSNSDGRSEAPSTDDRSDDNIPNDTPPQADEDDEVANDCCTRESCALVADRLCCDPLTCTCLPIWCPLPGESCRPGFDWVDELECLDDGMGGGVLVTPCTDWLMNDCPDGEQCAPWALLVDDIVGAAVCLRTGTLGEGDACESPIGECGVGFVCVSGFCEAIDVPLRGSDIIVVRFDLSPLNAFLGEEIGVEVDLINQGNEATGPFICSVVLSIDEQLDPDADLVAGTLNLPGVGANSGGTARGTITLNRRILTPGVYWPFVLCDSSGAVLETYETNNARRLDTQITLDER